jgi:uncharacterized protein (TIGR03435 family)
MIAILGFGDRNLDMTQGITVKSGPMKSLTLPLLLATLTLAQTPHAAKNPEFEVASVRPAVQDGDHDSDTDNGRFVTHNLTLKRLIAIAYDVDMKEVFGGPDWVDSDSYDINAKIPEEFARRAPGDVSLMIQSLLADRFHLAVHRETRQLAGYALLQAKQGSKLSRARPSDGGSNLHSNNTHVTARYETMDQFARYLSRNRDIGRLVANKTGLSEPFDFELDWAPAQLDSKPDAISDDRPTIFTALQQQLGLRLEAAKVSVEAVVIDRAEKPDAN